MAHDSSTMKDGRADAVHLGGTLVRFTHRRCGHAWTEDYSKRRPVAKRVGVMGVAILVRTWKTTGVIYECPKCKRQKRSRS